MKIKSVSIQAFKSYLLQDDGNFDFELIQKSGENEIANLVSLYAPNGFGKTSFYDAVDFAMTNNVNRYLRNNKAKHNTKQAIDSGNKYILRNKNADEYEADNKRELPTKLRVSTTIGDFENTVLKPKRNQKVDYLKNRSKPANTPNAETSFMQRILLSQEAIDSFLRETDPTERFEEFITNTDTELSELFENRETIRKIHKLVVAEIEDLNADLKRKEQQLSSMQQEDSPFSEANSLISRINTLNFGKLTELQGPFTDEKFESLTNEILIVESRISGSVEQEIEQYFSSWKKFLNQQPDLESDVEEYEEKTIKLNALKDLQDKEKEKEKLESELNSISKLIAEKNLLKEKAQSQKNSANKYIDYQLKEKELSDRLALIGTQISNKEVSISTVREGIEVERKRLLEATESLAERKKDHANIPQMYIEIDSLLTQKRKVEDERESLAVSVIKNTSERDNIAQKLECVSKLDVSKPVVESLKSETEFQKEIKELDKLHHLYITECDRLDSAQNDLEKLSSETQEANKQANAISRLLHEANLIISSSNLSSCPVCKQQYSSVDELQKLISSNDALSNYQKRLANNSATVSGRVSSAKQSIESLREDYEKLVSKLRESLTSELEKVEDSISQSKAKIDSCSEDSEVFHARINNLLSKTEQKSQDEFLKVSESKLVHIDKLVETSKSQLDKLQDQEISTSNDIAKLIKDQNQIRYEIAAHQEAKGEFTEFYEILKSLPPKKYEIAEALKSEFSLYIDGLAHEIATLTSKESKIRDKLQSLLQALSNKELCDPKSISREIEQTTSLRSSLRARIQGNSDLYLILKMKSPTNLNELNKIVEAGSKMYSELEQKKDLYLSSKNDCITLRSIADKARRFSRRHSLMEEVDRITKKLKKRSLVAEPLEKDLAEINNYIQNSANDFFKTDLINQIYSSIDPHPDFSEVHFDCTLTGSNKGELNIYAFDPNSDTKATPNLSFSSAQINVLSLSIFLARALTTRDHEGRPVQCIFIDDPIQSMDSINVLSLIDLLRNLIVRFDKQIIISTHDENFHELLKKKIPPKLFKSKFLRLVSFGKAAEDA